MFVLALKLLAHTYQHYIETLTHTHTQTEIGAFKVVSESGIASGIRRIEVVAGAAAVDHMNSMDAVVRSLTNSLKVGMCMCVCYV